MKQDIFKMAAEFNGDLLGMKRPLVPTRMDYSRKEWFATAVQEELNEFMDAQRLDDEVDAVLDLMYFAAGRLYEMGVSASPILEAIHNANMLKERGELSKRPGSKGFDATKPQGWMAPDVEGLLEMQPRPKLLVVGHGRHGKDTVGEMLRDNYGLSFKSSSLFCAEKVMMPLYELELDHPTVLDFVAVLDTEAHRLFRDFRLSDYHSPEQCFNDRHNHRATWFEGIKAWCNPHWRLGEAILAEHDVYCGVRNPAELNGIWNAGYADAILWVDASDRLPNEAPGSMKLEPWMATHHIDNNGTLDQLRQNVDNLMEAMYA